jgi:hypothetical protein
MARRSARVSAASAASVAQASPSTTPLGHAASSLERKKSALKAQTVSKQLPVRSTAKKSRFFDGQGSSDSEAESTPEASDEVYEEETGGDDEDTASEPDSLGDDDDDDYGSNSSKSKRRSSGKPAASDKKRKASMGETESSARKAVKGQELWREGVRTGLGPGNEVFIKKPKARDTGGIPYRNNVIHPNTMLFLQDLKEHNEREWLKGMTLEFKLNCVGEVR